MWVFQETPPPCHTVHASADAEYLIVYAAHGRGGSRGTFGTRGTCTHIIIHVVAPTLRPWCRHGFMLCAAGRAAGAPTWRCESVAICGARALAWVRRRSSPLATFSSWRQELGLDATFFSHRLIGWDEAAGRAASAKLRGSLLCVVRRTAHRRSLGACSTWTEEAGAGCSCALARRALGGQDTAAV